MLNIGSISINGTSRIDGKDVAYLGASFSVCDGGNYSITKNITDRTLCDANSNQCEADYAEFENMIMEYMKKFFVA